MQKCIPLLKVTKFLPHVFSTQRVEKLLQKSRIIPSLLSMFWILKSAFALEHRKDHQKIIIITTDGRCGTKMSLQRNAIVCTTIELPFKPHTLQYFIILYNTSKYFRILQNTSVYFRIFQNTSEYFRIPYCNYYHKYRKVLQSISMYYKVF